MGSRKQRVAAVLALLALVVVAGLVKQVDTRGCSKGTSGATVSGASSLAQPRSTRTESSLSDKRETPPIDAVSGTKIDARAEKYAIIVPMHAATQLEVMKTTWKIFPPCDADERAPRIIDLIFLSDAELPSLDVTGGHCFQRVYRLQPFIPSCYNVYAQAAPYCFFTMMLHLDLDRTYDAILQVEADSVPVKSNWLDAALENIFKPTSGEVWIHAAKNERGGNNFNGNGAYNLRNEGFRQFIIGYREWFYTKAVNSGDTAFDTNMITFAKEVGIFRNFSNRHLRASASLRNCDLMSLIACRSAVDASTWGGATPEALFVHSHDLKDPSRVRSQILVEMLGRDLKQLD